jgi:hypothetical protein
MHARNTCAQSDALDMCSARILPQRLPALLPPELADVDIKTILHYIGNGPVGVSAKALETALQHCLGHRTQEDIMGFIQEFEARGEAKGLAKGEAKVLIRLLEKRFGPVPISLRERIFASDIASIEAWFDRALDADDLLSIFPSGEFGNQALQYP